MASSLRKAWEAWDHAFGPAVLSYLKVIRNRMPWECAHCSGSEGRNQATIFCPDCVPGHRRMCGHCAHALHRPGCDKEYHSLELICDDDLSSQIGVVSLGEVIVLPLLLLYFMVRVGIVDGYTDAVELCPLTSRSRGFAARLDPAFYELFKTFFYQTCTQEDSYWRLILDTWVRAVLTETDSWSLILVTLPRALVIDSLVWMLFGPLLAFFSGIILACLHLAEKYMVPQFRLKRKQQLMPLIVFTSMITKVYPPPLTQRRFRLPRNRVDEFVYNTRRSLRVLFYHVYAVSAVLHHYRVIVLASAISIRVACLSLGMAGFFRWVASWVLGYRALEASIARFGAPSSIASINQIMDSAMFTSISFIFWRAFDTLSWAVGIMVVKLLQRPLLFISLVLASGYFYVHVVKSWAKQEKAFRDAWKAGDGGRDAILEHILSKTFLSPSEGKVNAFFAKAAMLLAAVIGVLCVYFGFKVLLVFVPTLWSFSR